MMTDTKRVEYGKHMKANAESILAITKKARVLYNNIDDDTRMAAVLREVLPCMATNCIVITELYLSEVKDLADANALRAMQFAFDEIVEFALYLKGGDEYAE